MGNWLVVIPEATVNMVLNPSAETSGNYAAKAGTTVAPSTTYSFKGLYSYRVQSNADDEGIELTLSALTNAAHYVTLMVRGTLPTVWWWSLDDTNYLNPVILKTEGDWTLYGCAFPAAQANASTTLHIIQSGAGSGDYYLDCIQVEAKTDYYTTYIDGSMDGGTWAGTAHASYSTRSSQSRAGGRLRDLEDYYDTYVTLYSGIGMPPLAHNVTGYSTLPGAEFQSSKIGERPFVLTFDLMPDSLNDLHLMQQGLIDAFKPDLVYPEQPVRLRYVGAGKTLEISAHYQGGLEGNIDPTLMSKLPAKFIAYDPFLYELAEQAASLTVNQSVADADYAVKRIAGVWSNITTEFNSNVYAFAEAPDGSIYIGGDFTNVGDANGDYIIKYNPTTGALTSLGTGMNGNVRALVVAADGTLYAGGEFTLAGGVANTAYIAKWDGANWTPLSTGLSSSVYGLAFGIDGALYIGGNFQNAGDANGDYIVKWTGAAWTSLGTGANGTVLAVAVGLDGSLYIGGDFTQAGGVSNTAYVAKWDGTTWNALMTGMDDAVRAFAVMPGGSIYMGGDFTVAGGVSGTAYVAKWNGTAFVALGPSVNQPVYSLAFDTTNVLYLGGVFTEAGDVALANRLAVWNGTTFAHVDIDLPGTPTVYAIRIFGSDLYVGYTTSGTATSSYSQTVTNHGKRLSYPIFTFKRVGGTTMVLEWIRNEATGKTLIFNYSLLDGETLVVDLSSPYKAITSSVYGNVLGRAVAPGSELSTWALLPGSNPISVYCSESGTPTKTAYLLAKIPHWSTDGAAV